MTPFILQKMKTNKGPCKKGNACFWLFFLGTRVEKVWHLADEIKVRNRSKQFCSTCHN